MEQIKDAPLLLRDPKRRLFSELTAETARPKENPTERAWKCLTGIELDPDTLRAQGLFARSADPESLWFDQMRARIQFQMRSCNFTRLAISSPMRGCGKTSLAANLSLSLARQTDQRVMLFDFDLRSPDMIARFDLEDIGPRHSFLIGSRRSFESNTLRVGTNLALSISAMPTTASSELLASANARRLIDEVQADFSPDIMLFDLPPVLPFDDALVAMEIMDCALLVAGADHSTIEEVDETERLVAERTQSLGVVLNRCRFIDQETARYDPRT